MTPFAARFAIALLAIATLLRFVGLGHHPLWIDEANSVIIAWEGFAGIPRALAVDGNPPLFYELLYLWMGVFGSSEVAVRALAACFGVASVGAVYWAAREFLPGRPHVPLIAAAITTLGPLHVAISRTCRMYSLTPLLAVLAVVALVRALRRESAPWLAVHTALLAAGLYAHNYFLFLLPLGPAVAALEPGPAGRRRAILASIAASVAATCAYAPWLPVLIDQAGSGVSAWIQPHWAATPPGLALFRSIEVMGVGAAFPSHLGPLGSLREVFPSDLLWGTVRVVGAALAVLLLGAGIALGGSSAHHRSSTQRDPSTRRDSIAALIALLVLPLAIPVLVSFVVQPVYLVGRYEMVAYAAFAILAARGLDTLFARSRGGAAVVAVSWVALSTLSLGAYFAVPPQDSELRSAEWVVDNARPGDVFVFPGYSRAVPEYYLRRMEFHGERVSFPQSVGRHMGWFDYESAKRHPAETRRAAAYLAAQLSVPSVPSVANAPPETLRERRVVLLDVDPVARRAGVTVALRAALRAEFGREESIPSAVASQPPPVYIYSMASQPQR